MTDSPAERLAKTIKLRKYRRGACSVKLVWNCDLRARREKLFLTMRDVAKAVGLSVTGYYAIEHGSDPQLTSAVKLAEFFAVPVETLWTKLEK